MKIIVVKPYDDEVLVFNKETGHYELALGYVKANFDDTFKDDGILQKRITKNSRRIYNYLFSRSYSYNNKVVTFMLNNTEEGRRFLKDILSSQMEADLESGYNDMGKIPAVSSSGQMLPREQIRANLICVDAEEIADNNYTYFDFNILYQSLFPSNVFLFVQSNLNKLG